MQRVLDDGDELLELASALIACDTTTRAAWDDPPRDEEKLQRLLAERLAVTGAQVEVWEPEPLGPGHPYARLGLDFRGRPQLAAGWGGPGGPSLLLNGHIDAVEAGPADAWRHDPFRAVVEDGRLYGRGSADMKGGLAGLCFALEALHRCDVRPRGAVVFCSNTDEESSGAGGWAAVDHGVSADAGICAEPTGFDAFVACRGATTGVLTVRGRAGHAELPQPDWTMGGAVNAIEKLLPLAGSLRHLRGRWQQRPEQHPLLSPSSIVPTVIRGGEWSVTYPDSCSLVCDVQYTPRDADAAGMGTLVQAEVMRCALDACSDDDWLAAHPPEWQWLDDSPPAEVRTDEGIVIAALGAARSV
ncbi:MAG TPA: M20/M25/M40 family metallo-hydrolase, partial [Thermoleophilia bacterium]|nr:M20/M25/M40 family metallo-hydrolase [Thermoleophilia bacterium]